MGYIASGYGHIKIKADEMEDAFLAACTTLAEIDNGAWLDTLVGGSCWATDPPTDVVTLAVAFDFEDTYADADPNGYRSSGPVDADLIYISHNDKYRDDMAKAFYEAIAPWAYAGVIDFIGEDDSYWRVRFREGTWEEHQGQIVYPSDTEEPE